MPRSRKKPVDVIAVVIDIVHVVTDQEPLESPPPADFVTESLSPALAAQSAKKPARKTTQTPRTKKRSG
jgi:hypothetical protein